MTETVTLMLFLATFNYNKPHFNTVVIQDVDAASCETIGQEYMKRHYIQVKQDFAKRWSYFTCLPTTLKEQ